LVGSPGGLPCCVVEHRDESTRPGRVMSGSGASSLVDQVCIDVPAKLFEDECRFWSAMTGWVVQSSSRHEEFKFLIRPGWSPLRVLLQRRADNDGPSRAHLDIASDDVKLIVADHVQLGATVLDEFDNWTAMRDPAGFPYCVTARNPGTGLLATPVPDYGA
ncbi:MAG TPA: VOC family protein, partial [Acidimicrobiales bacterium]|nr:VOC family protein [Acidimicrobiales bacterium]